MLFDKNRKLSNRVKIMVIFSTDARQLLITWISNKSRDLK